MSRSLNTVLRGKIILSSTLPSNCEGLEVIQLYAVMISHPVLISLCTFDRSFM